MPGRAYNTLNDARALAKFAHFGKKDLAGFDYFEHPKRVLAKVQAQGAPPFVQMAAILHDVPEDTRFSHRMLLELGFSEAVVELLRLLDRDESERNYNIRIHGGYDMYGAKDAKEFYYVAIRKNSLARMIKLADIADNTEEWRLSYLTEVRQMRAYRKYHFGLTWLHFEENLDFISAETRFPRLKSLVTESNDEVSSSV